MATGIIIQEYVRAGEMMGMPVVEEAGLCTDDDATRTTLSEYETGRVELAAIPRAQGLIAKALDGQELQTTTLTADVIGTLNNCLQLGKTDYFRFAPVQPIGIYSGSGILRYRRRWVQLQEGDEV